MTTDDLEEIKKRTQKGDRVSAAAAEAKTREEAVRESVYEQLEAIENGDVTPTLSLRNPKLYALVRAIEDDDELFTEVSSTLAEDLGKEAPDDLSRTSLLRLALQSAFRRAAPDIVDAANDAEIEFLRDDF